LRDFDYKIDKISQSNLIPGESGNSSPAINPFIDAASEVAASPLANQ
jgi:hypothetical protein